MLDTVLAQQAINQHCWWMLAGIVDYKLCERDFDCEHCPFDSVLQLNAPHAPSTALDCQSNLVDVFYHPSHIWARVEDRGNIRVGLDDFAQTLLGRIYAVALPHEGLKVEQGKYRWSVTHKTGETSLVVPLSGVVLEVNWKLQQSPSLLNVDPYGAGWAFVISPTDLRTGLRNLFYGLRANAWHRAELERLHALAAEIAGAHSNALLLPDGGKLRKDFLSELSPDQTSQLINSFLPNPESARISNRHSRIPSSKRR